MTIKYSSVELEVEWDDMIGFWLPKNSEFLQQTINLRKQKYPAMLSRMIDFEAVPNAMNNQGMFQSFTVLILSSSALHKFDPRYPNIVFLKWHRDPFAWEHANPMVVEHITLLTTDNDVWLQARFIELKFHDRLSIADAIVLVQFLGLTKTAAFISEVTPDTLATLTKSMFTVQ